MTIQDWAEQRPSPEALRMVRDQLVARGITDPRIRHWMARIPRDIFLPPGLSRQAYQDRAVPTHEGQTVSQPFMVAAMTQALRPEAGGRTLEVGTGSGYQTLLLALLAGEVCTVERFASLSNEARGRLDALGVWNVRYREGDGTVGWPAAAPFDRILVTAGAPRIPPSLLAQLSPGGHLVIPVGDRDLQRLLRVTPERGRLRSESLMECRFVPLTGAEGWSGPDDPRSVSG